MVFQNTVLKCYELRQIITKENERFVWNRSFKSATNGLWSNVRTGCYANPLRVKNGRLSFQELPCYAQISTEVITKYFVTNLNKHITQHLGQSSRLLMYTGSDTVVYM